MYPVTSFRDKIVASIVPFICAFFMLYLGYNGLYGDHGLVRLMHLNDDIERLEYELADLQQERELLELRTQLLRPDSLDLDLLDEQARAMLGYARHNDLVIFELPKDAPSTIPSKN